MNVTRIARYIHFCLIIDQLCNTHRASVISWWRTIKRNADLKGHKHSFHLEGLAADLVTDDPARQRALIADAKSLGLQVAPKKRGVHVELDYRHP